MPNRERKRQPAGPTPLAEQVAVVRAFLPDFGHADALARAEEEFGELDDAAQRFTLASQNAVLIDLAREQLRASKTIIDAIDETNELLAELVAGGGAPVDDGEGIPRPDGGDLEVEPEPEAPAEHVEAELLVPDADGEEE